MSIAKLDSQLCFALYSASSHLTSIYRALLEPLDLTYTQFIVMMALWEQDNVPITVVAERTGLSKATMTPLLKRLEQKEFIQRQVLADNERQKNIVVTKKGKELALSSEDITKQAFCATGLTGKQARDVISLCRKITMHEKAHEKAHKK